MIPVNLQYLALPEYPNKLVTKIDLVAQKCYSKNYCNALKFELQDL